MTLYQLRQLKGNIVVYVDKFNKENIKKTQIFLLFTILPVPKVNRKKE